MATFTFSIAASAFDVSLLPEAARQTGSLAFRDAVRDFLSSQFRGFGGQANIRVDDQTISVIWTTDSQRPNPVGWIVQKIREGKQAEGIQLLELLLSNRPDDPVLLYNLGLALSDSGRLDRAEECLRRATELNPDDANIAVGLGVALGRMGRSDEAVAVLRAAVERDPNNPWAHRALGGLLFQAGDLAGAIAEYGIATRMLPEDQIAWLGLADANRLAGNTKQAEEAYSTVVRINPHSELAEKARAGSNLLARTSFEQSKQVVVRQDAVHYCLDALNRFAKMPAGELQKLSLELAMAGRNGFAVHDPDSRYRVKGIDGEFSGLAMVCFLYVAMQRIAPGANIGFDLAAEYAQAKKMFEAST